MYQKLIKNDIKKSKLITMTVTGFIVMAALFTSLGVSLLVNLMGSIDKFMEDAKAPDYFQMHAGVLDLNRLNQFAEEDSDVKEMQVIEFVNFDGGDIAFGEDTLSDSVEDNGLVVQNKKFDFLLDLDNEIIQPKDGEIYVPIRYMRDERVEVGETLWIQDKAFIVKGFLRDSQMNPTLAGSKRFLVSENDFKVVKEKGSIEYIIQFILNQNVNVSKFQAKYIDAGLESNGPAGTRSLVSIMNGFTDGIVIAMLLLISLFILVIAFLCVRFTLVAKMEEEYKEIGVLKAIGIRVSSIKKLYLAKYSVIAAVGSILGFLISIAFQGMMLENIRLFMGKSGNELLGTVLGSLGALFVFLIVVLYVKGVLRRFRKISPVQAVRFGAPVSQAKGSRGMKLTNNRVFSTSVFLGIKDVFTRKRLYVVMLLVVIISCFMMVVPQNIENTITNKSFMSYMGVGDYDFMVGIQRVDKIREKAQGIERVMLEDGHIEKHAMMLSQIFDMPMEDGSMGKLKVELGDHTLFPLQYIKGSYPQTENEIALSTMNGDELEKGVGDEVVLVVDGQKRNFVVCGLYSDVTNGGMTAKGIFTATRERVLGASVLVKVKDASSIDKISGEYKKQFPYAKLAKLSDYFEQSLGSMIKSLKSVSLFAVIASIFLIIFITLLFIKTLIVKDRYQISVLKSLGFTSVTIRNQYIIRALVVMILGISIGTIAANTLGEYVGLAIISIFGGSVFHFNINWLFAFVISPAVIAVCVYIATRLGTSDIQSIKVSEYIKE